MNPEKAKPDGWHRRASEHAAPWGSISGSDDNPKPTLTGNRCQCCACGEYFGSERAFSRHRIGHYGVDRRCARAPDLLASGWIRNARGFLLEPHRGRTPVKIAADFAHGGRTSPRQSKRALIPRAAQGGAK